MTDHTNDQSDHHRFASGARSSEVKPDYRLIPQPALRRLATRFRLGADHYGENNWRSGLQDPSFLRDRLNHAIEHLALYSNGDRTDDHLAAAMCNLSMLVTADELQTEHHTVGTTATTTGQAIRDHLTNIRTKGIIPAILLAALLWFGAAAFFPAPVSAATCNPYQGECGAPDTYFNPYAPGSGEVSGYFNPYATVVDGQGHGEWFYPSLGGFPASQPPVVYTPASVMFRPRLPGTTFNAAFTATTIVPLDSLVSLDDEQYYQHPYQYPYQYPITAAALAPASTPSVPSVPEPVTLTLTGLGLLLFGRRVLTRRQATPYN